MPQAAQLCLFYFLRVRTKKIQHPGDDNSSTSTGPKKKKNPNILKKGKRLSNDVTEEV